MHTLISKHGYMKSYYTALRNHIIGNSEPAIRLRANPFQKPSQTAFMYAVDN